MKLITGHPRSGTRYVSEVLCALGYDIPHEALGKCGSVGWIFARPGRIFSKFVSPEPYGEKFHVVRNPLNVVGTMPTITKESWCFLIAEVGKPDGYDKIEWGFWTWLHWNTLCERFCSYRFKIEDFSGSSGVRILREMGFEAERFPDISKKTNHREFTPYDLSRLIEKNPELMEAVNRKAQEYGYDLRLHGLLER